MIDAMRHRMESIRSFLKCIKTDHKWFAIKLFALPFLSLVLFCFIFVPRLPGTLGTISDILFKYLEPIGFPVFLVALTYFVPILVVTLIIICIPKQNHKYTFIILLLFVNVSGILFSFYTAKTLFFNCGLRMLAFSANPVIKTLEKHHDEKGEYPASLQSINTGYLGWLSKDVGASRVFLSYSRTSDDDKYDLKIVLPTKRYCSDFIEICRDISLRYLPDRELKTGCSGEIIAYYDCVEKVSKNWYLVRSYQHF